MELSQTALAMLLLCGIPAGAVFSIVYTLTEFDVAGKRILTHLKDFCFMVLAGIVAVLLIYYVNAGQARFHVLFGMVMGYVLTHLVLSKLVLRIRNALFAVLMAPLNLIWSFTLGRLCTKARMAMQIKRTEQTGRTVEQLASQGF